MYKIETIKVIAESYLFLHFAKLRMSLSLSADETLHAVGLALYIDKAEVGFATVIPISSSVLCDESFGSKD